MNKNNEHKHEHGEACGCGATHEKHNHDHAAHEHVHGKNCGCGGEHGHGGAPESTAAHEAHGEGCGCKAHADDDGGGEQEDDRTSPAANMTAVGAKYAYTIKNLGCANCAAKMEKKINELPQVREASINFTTATLIVFMAQAVDKKQFERDVVAIMNSIENGVKIVERISAAAKPTSLLHKNGDNGEAAHEHGAGAHDVHDKEHAHGKEHAHDHEKQAHAHSHEHTHEHGESAFTLKKGVLWAAGLVLFFGAFFVEATIPKLALYLCAYIIFGGPVLLKCLSNLRHGNIFDENFLMTVATIGAFLINEWPEAVAVMLFYTVGELLQDLAVERSRKSINALMDIAPDFANIVQSDGSVAVVSPAEVGIGSIIIVKPGERVPLDGDVIEGYSALDTAALTGESLPVNVEPGSHVLSGSINASGLLKVRTTKLYGDSAASRILELVENASAKKAKTEQFITRFAAIYTPIMCGIAAGIAFGIPVLLQQPFSPWIYKALMLLVVSCPCALVLSVPVSFFGGIGAASHRGVLVKGGNTLEKLAAIDAIVFDKTGTLTKGNFDVVDIILNDGTNEAELLAVAAAAESFSTHPAAKSIVKYFEKTGGNAAALQKNIKNYEDLAGFGVTAQLDGATVFCGSAKLMSDNGIAVDALDLDLKKRDITATAVYIAKSGALLGAILLGDEIKDTSRQALTELKALGINKLVMLTGDNVEAAQKVAGSLGITQFFANLLPQDKVASVEQIIATGAHKVAFAGDGINDSPVLAMADVGIAMGAAGSDAAIETADVVLMNDDLRSIGGAIKIGRKTMGIARQNVAFALLIKLLFVALGLAGIAGIWVAVIGDVGVALLCVLNSLRILSGAK